MVRSLGLVLLVIVPVWFLAQPPASDVAQVRVVDPSSDLRAWTQTVPRAPVPGALPDGWRPTVSQLLRDPAGLRVGWNTPSAAYAELAETAGPPAAFVADTVGQVPASGVVDIAGAPWQRYVEADGSISLVRTEGSATVVVGTRRGTAPLAELVRLAGSLRPGA